MEKGILTKWKILIVAVVIGIILISGYILLSNYTFKSDYRPATCIVKGGICELSCGDKEQITDVKDCDARTDGKTRCCRVV